MKRTEPRTVDADVTLWHNQFFFFLEEKERRKREKLIRLKGRGGPWKVDLLTVRCSFGYLAPLR